MAMHLRAGLLLAAGSIDVGALHMKLNRNGPYKQALDNHWDLSYTAKIKVGGQQMDAVLDTGSFDLEVVSARCGSTCNGAGESKYFNSKKSNTYHEGKLLQLTSYESGDVLAESGTEQVEIGPLTIKEQQFWEVVYAKLDILTYGDFQAILGVGPPGIDKKEVAAEASMAGDLAQKFEQLGFVVPDGYSAKSYEELMPKMKSVLEELDDRIFSVCLQRESLSPGYFVWNDHDPSQNSAFTEIDIAGKVTWGVQLESPTLKGSNDVNTITLTNEKSAAIVDSGTSLIMVPTAVYDKIYSSLQKVGASCDNMDQLPDLEFNLAGKALRLPPSAYMGMIDGSTSLASNSSSVLGRFFQPGHTLGLSEEPTSLDEPTCQLLIGKLDITTQLGPMWILGMPFFREYYTTFQLGDDMQDKGGRRLFVAPASTDCEPSSNSELRAEKKHHTPYHINPAKVHVPKWVMKAAQHGVMDL